ncbi:MAG: FAD-binding oxidoreductase [Chloroflexi bacterium]|nr:FAD-binding oxidoreductase [Chloroflexota bacterium]
MTSGVEASPGAPLSVSQTAIEHFRDALAGALIESRSQEYNTARRVWNASVDKRPAWIAQCSGASDVVRSVQFARENQLVVAVRGGGHSVAGKSVCDGGLVIDLSMMKGVQVDPARRTVIAQPGLRLGELDRQTHVFGLATPLGIVSDTGVAGLTLGGGLGWLNGKYGLACDNLLSAQVVTADGGVLTASAVENDDLLWGLRGGGGNFGIVTSFEFSLHPVESILGGMVVHPISAARDMLRFYSEFSTTCPDEFSTMAALVTGPDASVAAAMVGCCLGPTEIADNIVRPLRAFGTPSADLFNCMSFVEMQSLLDGAFPDGNGHYWKASYLRRLRADAIEVLVEQAIAKPSPLSIIALQHMHGAAARVSGRATAFPHRQEQFDCLILAQWSDPAEANRNIEWARETWERLQPFLDPSVYVNNLGDEGDARIRAAYGANYGQLVSLKMKFDPTNCFRQNQNVVPRA